MLSCVWLSSSSLLVNGNHSRNTFSSHLPASASAPATDGNNTSNMTNGVGASRLPRTCIMYYVRPSMTFLRRALLCVITQSLARTIPYVAPEEFTSRLLPLPWLVSWATQRLHNHGLPRMPAPDTIIIMGGSGFRATIPYATAS